MELDDEAFESASQEFLHNRLAELTTGEHQEAIRADQNSSLQGFIQPDTQIFPEALGKGYRLDDLEIYSEALPYLRRFYTNILPQLGDPEKAFRNAVLFAAQNTQQSYFGSVHSGANALAAREMLTGDFMDDDAPDVRSIAKFKGVAMCAERAAVANNVLQVFGMQPVLELGKLQIDDKHPELHAYLFIRDGKGEERVFDPTNPTLTFGTDGSLLQVNPAFYPAGDSLTFRDPDTPIVATHRTYEFDGEAKVIQKEETYRFSVGPFGQELHPQ